MEISSLSIHAPTPILRTDQLIPEDSVESVGSQLKSWCLACAKSYSLIGAITVADLTTTRLISRWAADHWQFCFGQLTSSASTTFFRLFATPLTDINDTIRSWFGTSLGATTLVPAVCEEIEFRWLVQEMVLKELPRTILAKTAPQYAHLVDHPAVRVNRVILSALFFTYCHLNILQCTVGGDGICQLIGGLLYGSLYEFSNLSLVDCINLHALYNILRE